MRNHTLPSLLLLVAATLPAQTFQISYPQDTTMMSSGNIVPLGSFPTTGNFEEGRWQALIPSSYLPTTPGPIMGFSVICQTFTGTINYRSLRVTMSPTTATTLGTTFAANLVAPSTVLNQTNFNVTYTSWQWAYIPFDIPFIHDGVSNVVFEIRKEATPIASGIATMATSGNPSRPDLPSSVYTFGMVNSGAANATNSTVSVTAPLQLRLHAAGRPTIFLKSDRLTNGNNEFPLGGSIDLSCDAPAGSRWVALVDGFFSPRFTIPGVFGAGIVLPTVVLPPRTVTTTPDTINFGIPNNPVLVGVSLAWQGVVILPTSAVYFTNGAYCIIRA